MDEEIHSEYCAECGKKAVRIVNGKEMPIIWCNMECQNKWLESFKTPPL